MHSIACVALQEVVFSQDKLIHQVMSTREPVVFHTVGMIDYVLKLHL